MKPPDPGDLAAAMGVTPETARSYLRAAVTLPDGRTITGGQPGTSAATLEEHQLRDKLAAQLGGITEAVLPYGRADVLTASAVFEVEPYRSWRHGVRQALAYSAQTGLPPAVALFGAVTQEGMLSVLGKLRGRYGTSPVPVALWWWDRARWEEITGTTKCRVVARRIRPAHVLASAAKRRHDEKSAVVTARWADPEFRARWRASMQARNERPPRNSAGPGLVTGQPAVNQGPDDHGRRGGEQPQGPSCRPA